MSMLAWLTLPFYNFCGFRSVAVDSVYKLQLLADVNSRSRSLYAIADPSVCLSFVVCLSVCDVGAPYSAG